MNFILSCTCLDYEMYINLLPGRTVFLFCILYCLSVHVNIKYVDYLVTVLVETKRRDISILLISKVRISNFSFNIYYYLKILFFPERGESFL